MNAFIRSEFSWYSLQDFALKVCTNLHLQDKLRSSFPVIHQTLFIRKIQSKSLVVNGDVSLVCNS